MWPNLSVTVLVAYLFDKILQDCAADVGDSSIDQNWHGYVYNVHSKFTKYAFYGV